MRPNLTKSSKCLVRPLFPPGAFLRNSEMMMPDLMRHTPTRWTCGFNRADASECLQDNSIKPDDATGAIA
jgi:hypothetical protein